MLVTIKTFSHGFEAHVARAKLDSEGIPATLADEHMGNLLPISEVRLQVPEPYAQRAIEILSQDENTLD